MKEFILPTEAALAQPNAIAVLRAAPEKAALLIVNHAAAHVRERGNPSCHARSKATSACRQVVRARAR